MDLFDIPRTLQGISNIIAYHGIDATLDPRNANPPCAVIQFDSIDSTVLCGDVNVKVVVYLVAPDNGIEQALSTLFSMAAKLPEKYTRNITSDVVPVGGTAPLPALRLGPFEI